MQLYLAWNTHLCKGLCQVLHFLRPSQSSETQAIWITQATPCSGEAMEFHLYGLY
jgi:hypothetical protein